MTPEGGNRDGLPPEERGFIAHEVEIGPDIALVVTEGNYLLLSDRRVHQVRRLFDAVWLSSMTRSGRRLVANVDNAIARGWKPRRGGTEPTSGTRA